MSHEPYTLDSVKESKFLIPVELHVQLHRHRVLTGQSISETVNKALDGYLERLLPGDDAA